MNIRYFFSELRLYVCNHIVNKIPSIVFRMWFYRKIMKFSIGKGSYIFLGCEFDKTESLSIGENTVINANCRLDTRGGLVIGNNCSISNNVTILTADHDMDTQDMQGRNRQVVIKDYVWLGTDCMILPGLTLGKGVVVAAKALVCKDVENFQVVAGVPAKIIRERKCKENYTYSASYKRLFQ